MIFKIIQLLKRYKRDMYIKNVLRYINKGNSYLYDSFVLSINTQESVDTKYVTIGDNSILDCTIEINSNRLLSDFIMRVGM